MSDQDTQRQDLAAMNCPTAWNMLLDTLRTVGEQAVGSGINGALDERDLAERFLGLVAIVSNAMRMTLWEDPAYPIIVPFDLLPALTKIGGNSPDADYHSFAISPMYQYRLRGQRGTAPFFNIQSQSMRYDEDEKREKMYLSGIITDEQLQRDADGNFEVLISKEKPADYTGNWLPMDDRTFSCPIRQYHHNRDIEPEVKFTVEVLNPPKEPEILNDIAVATRIFKLNFFCKFWFDARTWYPEAISPSNINRFMVAEKGDGSRSQDLGLAADVQYKVGAWRLAGDEALIVEGTPPDSRYWMFQHGDRWMETADFRRRRVSINNSDIFIDSDGKYRIVLAARDPGVAKWIDNGGRTEGYMAFRWSPAESFEMPVARVVKISDLAGNK